MSKLFGSIAGVVSRKPVAALALLALVTAMLVGGMSLRQPHAGNDLFLPGGSEVAEASDTLSDSFPDTAGLSNVTILHRSDFLTPDGLSQIDSVIAAAVATNAGKVFTMFYVLVGIGIFVFTQPIELGLADFSL